MVACVGMAEVVNAYYDPGLQRWINRDPIQENGGINLYSFIYNDPNGWVDFFGLFGGGQRCWEQARDRWQNRFRSPRDQENNFGIPRPARGHSDFTGADEFDFNREDRDWRTMPLPGGAPRNHFQERWESWNQVADALLRGDREAFERALHRLQDWYAHRMRHPEDNYTGRRWAPGEGEFGHLWESLFGRSPDNNANAWELAEQETIIWVDRWRDRYGRGNGGGSCP